MKKNLVFFADFFVGVLVFLAFFISLLPLISWWGGVLALGLTFYYWKTQKKGVIYKLALLSVFLGLFLHLGCRVHSSLLVHQLKKEIDEKKQKVFLEKK